MLIKVKLLEDIQKRHVIEEYEDYGYVFERQEYPKVLDGSSVLVFRASDIHHAARAASKNTDAYLEFSNGETVKLHIRLPFNDD